MLLVGKLRIVISVMLFFILLSGFVPKGFAWSDWFDNIQWGAPPSVLGNDKILLEVKNNVKFYINPSDELILGKAKLKTISYVFNNEQLVGVMVSVNDESDQNLLREYAFEKFGNPDVSNYTSGEYKWMKNGVFIYFKNTQTTCLSFVSTKYFK